ncbi:hypothetical protein [Bradyrhizobium genosp. P]|uniref:RraA family protein n=1 Tax=Bradyrhizobium genosp. P TaxID=83641 RepID=UPI003CEC7D7D
MAGDFRRDGPAIRELGFKVFSYGLFAKGAVKETLGTINQPIAVQPGDIVSADDDGVMVVPKATSAAVVKNAPARDGKEAGNHEGTLDAGDIRAFGDETGAFRQELHLGLRPGAGCTGGGSARFDVPISNCLAGITPDALMGSALIRERFSDPIGLRATTFSMQ